MGVFGGVAMMGSFNSQKPLRALVGIGLLASVGLTGCQVTTGSQTLPSPYYLNDDVQYHPPGSEFKLAKEAAATKAYSQDQARQAAMH
jgi:hypothetical protein